MTLALIAITIALLLSAAVTAVAQRDAEHHVGPRPFAALPIDL